MTDPSPPRPRRAPGPASLVAILGATCAALVLGERASWLYRRSVVDDALISMQYARHLAHGDGLVFNLGERVEGYTNFLWVLVMTPVHALTDALGVEFVPVIAHVELAMSVGAVALTGLVVARVTAGSLAPLVVALAAVALDDAYVVWSVLGLETHLLALLFMAALALVASRNPRAAPCLGVVLAAAHMTRPDAGLFGAAVVASLAIEALLARLRGLPADETRVRVRGALLPLATWAVLYAAYFVARWRYFGDPLPNTYYLKLGGGRIDAWARGAEYVRSFVGDRAWWPLAAFVAVLGAASPVTRALLLFLPAHVVYVAYVGGDFYPGHRFLVPELPLFAVLLGVAVERVAALASRRGGAASSRARLGAAVVAGALLAASYGRLAARGPTRTEITRWRDVVAAQRAFYRWLAPQLRPGDSLATGAIGHPAYYGGLRIVDVFGVVDRALAHSSVADFGKGKAGHEKVMTRAELLSRRPTFIEQGYAGDDFWRDGYCWWSDGPMGWIEGIWRRDPLAGQGRFVDRGELRFDPEATAAWSSEGDAFAAGPVRSAPPGQRGVLGTEGAFADSFTASRGDAATGALRSPPFALVGDLMVVRVGGGHDPERLRVSLVVDAERVASATGRDSERLGRVTWDIAALRGKTGVLELVDRAEGAWGHLLVDEVRQWARTVR